MGSKTYRLPFLLNSAKLDPTVRSNWPRPLYDLMQLLRSIKSTNKKIEAIEYEKFKGSIWTCGSTAASSIQDAIEEDRSKIEKLIEFVNTKEASTLL